MSDPQPDALSPPYDDAVVDTTVSQEARAYDYLLGGVDNFEVDRQAVLRMYGSPEGVEQAKVRVRANRDFLGRAVRFLAGEVGIRQFLDLGTGIPNADNVHGVAQDTAPECRVVYVDHDPVVLAHAHKLRATTAQGRTSFVFADIRDHETVIRQASQTLDFDQPIGLVIVGVFHHFRDEEDPKALVRHYLDAIPSGSYLVMEQVGRENDAMQKLGHTDFTMVPRTRDEFAPFFDGVELIEPGLVYVDQWRPDGPLPSVETRHPCGVGRKP